MDLVQLVHAAAKTSHQGQPRGASYATYVLEGRIAVGGGGGGKWRRGNKDLNCLLACLLVDLVGDWKQVAPGREATNS